MSKSGPQAKSKLKISPKQALEINQEFQKGAALLNNGQFKEALELFEALLPYAPHNPDLLNLLGIAHCQLQQFGLAIPYLEKAIKNRPGEASYYCNLGNAYQSIGKVEQALLAFEKAISRNPLTFQAFYNLGNVYRDIEQYDKAIEYYKKAISLNNQFVDAYNNLGTVLKDIGKLDEAVIAYQNGLKINPNSLGILNNLGLVYKDLKKKTESIQCYQQILAFNPNFYETYLNLASLWKDQGNYPEAYQLYQKAIALKSSSPLGYGGLAMTYSEEKKFSEAHATLDQALELFPNNAELYANLGALFEREGKYKASREAFEKVVLLKPEDDQAKFSLATLYLLEGDFKNGWKYYEHRLSFKALKIIAQKFLNILNQPKWQGEDLTGKIILVISEQGYGDTIQFCRYLSLLANLGAKVMFRPQDGLEELFLENDLKTQILPSHVIKEHFYFDYYTALISLPYAFQTEQATVPAPEGYLKANPLKKEEYRQKYFNHNLFKVGLVWQGATHHPRDSIRSLPLQVLEPLFTLSGVQFYSFQKGEEGEAQIANFAKKEVLISLGPTFQNFSDTAAALDNLDLLITVDTAIAHLGGALGLPTWIFTAASPEYRWMLEREDSPWYKSVRLFRQEELSDWSETIARVVKELKNLVPKQKWPFSLFKKFKAYLPRIQITFKRE